MRVVHRFAQTTLWLASGSILCFAAFTVPASKIVTDSKARLSKSKADEKIDFNRDIRPILSNKCLACHGQDPKAVQAGLKLNVRESAVSKLSDGVVAIVPGHPEQSALITRTTSKDPDLMMPPKGSNKTITDEDRATLKRWIAEGAEYKQHWAFVPPVRSTPPKADLKGWVRSPIDNFVLAKMEDHDLHPSPEADKATLLRRVSLDLTGIPPTPAELKAFEANQSPKAYEEEVDRLLASPRYAERMSMDWMDYARYADSHGYQNDWERYQWRWRDWVLDAFNDNMPYDQFITKQLAGDLLPKATEEDKIATGFGRNHRINTETGVVVEEWRTENVIDRVETTSTVFLGLTAGCARCHDHKYDPISQKDFYSLCAYFNSIAETGSGPEAAQNEPPTMLAPTREQAPKFQGLEAEVKSLREQMAKLERQHEAEAQTWVIPPVAGVKDLKDAILARYRLGEHPSADGGVPTPTVMGKVTFNPGRSTGAAYFKDGSHIDLGNVGAFDATKPFSYSLWVKPQGVTGSPVSRMDDKASYRGWDLYIQDNKPAVHIISKWPENALKTVSTMPITGGQWSHIAVTYDGSSKAAGVHIYINGKLVKTTFEADQLNGSIATDVTAKVGTRTGGEAYLGQVDDLALYNRALTAEEIAPLAAINPATPLLAIPIEKRTPEQRTEISADWCEVHVPAHAAYTAEMAKNGIAFTALYKDITTVMIMQDLPKPRQAHVLIRGQYDHLGDPVNPRTPTALPQPPPGAPANRLGLAEWITSPSNPLTARVAVNRMWERCFGTGIVASSDDFGTRAEFPTHPELLDWLATEFMRKHWDTKAMYREIVTSATYRQSSFATKSALESDPSNKYLARGPRFRLPAEVIRDQAIYAAGMLTEKLGGPSVRPYQPNGIWDDASLAGNLHGYKHDVGANLHRRSLYTFWKRTGAPPEMTLFDVPSREYCTVRRARTDTPLQALALLDDETYIEAARALAQRAIREAGTSPRARIAFMFTSLVGRAPSEAEAKILGQGLWEGLTHYQKNLADAERLINIGDWPTPSNLDPAGLAAYTNVASTILNLDETITKE